MSLMLHCGGLPATFDDITNIELPERTSSYTPVAHGDLVRLVEEEVTSRLKIHKPERSFGLNRHGNQMFGVLKYNLFGGENEGLDLSAFNLDESKGHSLGMKALTKYGFSIGMRNSYDKSMSIGLAGGTNCFVCDNLCFSGSSFTIMRTHTAKVWDDIVPMVMMKMRLVAEEFLDTVKFQEDMKHHAIPQERGYEILGLARGRGILTPNQMSVAMDEWRATNKNNSDHMFAPHRETSYALYSAFTHGIKLGNISKKIDQYTGASHLFEELQLDQVEDAVWSH